MATPRRIYIYLVSAISLQAFAWAIIDIIRGLLISPLNPSPISLAWHIAVILVSLPVFLVHWLWGQRLAKRDREEREANVRTLYLFAMQAAFLAPAIMSTFGLITTLFLWIAGQSPVGHYPPLNAQEAVLFYLVSLIVLGLLWYYHQRIIRQDSMVIQIKGTSATIRRLYVLAFSAVGLTMTSMGFMYILRELLLLIIGGDVVGEFSAVSFISDIARLFVGVPLWLVFWLWAQRLFAGGGEEERQSALRKFYLYAVIFVAVISTITSTTLILQGLLSSLIVGSAGSSSSSVSIPISIIVTMVILWVYHSRVLKDDIEVAEEIERQAGLRRLYYYLIAGIGLAAFVAGLSGILSVTIRSLDEAAFGTGLQEQLTWFLALIITGLPVWILPWNQIQNKATSSGESGISERRSLVRRIYIYFFLFVSTATMISSVIYIIFQVISMILGEIAPSLSEIGQPVAFSLIALGVWLYHWFVLRKDRELSQIYERSEFADTQVVVLKNGDPEFSQSLMEGLVQENLGIQLQSLEISKASSAAASAEEKEHALSLLNQAKIIIGPWDMVLADKESGSTPDVVNAVVNSTSVKLLVPTRSAGWEWAGVEPWNMEFFVRQTISGVKQIIANSTVKPVRPLGTGAIIGIIFAVIFLLILLGIPISYFFGFLF